MEKRRLISLRSVLLQYLVRTALACLLVAVEIGRASCRERVFVPV